MRILVVDDNAELAENLAELLASDQLQVYAHSNPVEALAWARTHDFDTALLDVRMPSLSGIELMRLLRAHHPRARFILMSAFSQDAPLDPLQDRVDARLAKPLDLSLLVEALEHPP